MLSSAYGSAMVYSNRRISPATDWITLSRFMNATSIATARPRRRVIADPATPPFSRQKWIARPYAASTDSCIVSLIVGCGNTVCIRSSSVVSSVRAIV